MSQINTFTGTIISIDEVIVKPADGEKKAWSVQKFRVLERGKHHSRAIQFQCKNKRTAELLNKANGDYVTVYYELDSSVNKFGNTYVNLFVSKIEDAGQAPFDANRSGYEPEYSSNNNSPA